jgi:hypothetical protein
MSEGTPPVQEPQTLVVDKNASACRLLDVTPSRKTPKG